MDDFGSQRGYLCSYGAGAGAGAGSILKGNILGARGDGCKGNEVRAKSLLGRDQIIPFDGYCGRQTRFRSWDGKR